MLHFTDCPACGSELQVPIDLLGRRVKCPNCEKHFAAPHQVAEVRVAAPPPVVRPLPIHHSHFCCPFCQSRQRPVIRRRTALAGWIVFAALLVFCFPICWLGFLVRERYHLCYDCGIRLD
jgi:hypothetical protein